MLKIPFHQKPVKELVNEVSEAGIKLKSQDLRPTILHARVSSHQLSCIAFVTKLANNIWYSLHPDLQGILILP
jgi:hypothetical protein